MARTTAHDRHEQRQEPGDRQAETGRNRRRRLRTPGERKVGGLHAWRNELVRDRELARQRRAKRRHLGRGLGSRVARFETCPEHQPVGLATRQTGNRGLRVGDTRHRRRYPEIGRDDGHPAKVFAGHADDGHRMSVQVHGPADHGAIAVEAAQPEALAQDGNRTGARAVRCRRRRTRGRTSRRHRAPESSWIVTRLANTRSALSSTRRLISSSVS